MDVLDFNSLINQLVDKISKEQKQIFSNVLSFEAISGNITATISDHLPHFMQ